MSFNLVLSNDCSSRAVGFAGGRGFAGLWSMSVRVLYAGPWSMSVRVRDGEPWLVSVRGEGMALPKKVVASPF